MDSKTPEYLSRQYSRDSGWIERGLEACERASIDINYFIQRYLEKDITIPMNIEVNKHSLDIQKEWVHRGKL